MDNPMAISGERIKALREAKAWSQAHLAEAASLSLRTVQRVEAEGTASAETRLAIAAALDVLVDELNAAPPVVEPHASSDVVDPGPVNTLAMFGTLGAGLLFSLWLGSQLPARVASHFGVTGEANAHMSRDGFVTLMCLMMVGLPLLMRLSLERAVKRRKVKIPNAGYWFAEPRREATVRFLFTHFTWFGLIVTGFMGYVFWLVAAANAGAPAHPVLELGQIYAALGVFLAAVAIWVTVLNRHFRRETA